jgi:hypothetical protein
MTEQHLYEGQETVASRGTLPNNEMKRTKPAMARMTRSSPLNSVLSRLRGLEALRWLHGPLEVGSTPGILSDYRRRLMARL